MQNGFNEQKNKSWNTFHIRPSSLILIALRDLNTMYSRNWPIFPLKPKLLVYADLLSCIKFFY